MSFLLFFIPQKVIIQIFKIKLNFKSPRIIYNIKLLFPLIFVLLYIEKPL